MVAITVILAAVIGTFVLGLGDQVQQTTPSAQFSTDYNQGDYNTAGDSLEVTHDGGDGISGDQLFATISGAKNSTDANDQHEWDTDLGGAAEVSAGNGVTIDDTQFGDAGNDFDLREATVRLTWQANDGDRTATLRTWDGPNA